MTACFRTCCARRLHLLNWFSCFAYHFDPIKSTVTYRPLECLIIAGECCTKYHSRSTAAAVTIASVRNKLQGQDLVSFSLAYSLMLHSFAQSSVRSSQTHSNLFAPLVFLCDHQSKMPSKIYCIDRKREFNSKCFLIGLKFLLTLNWKPTQSQNGATLPCSIFMRRRARCEICIRMSVTPVSAFVLLSLSIENFPISRIKIRFIIFPC